MTAMPASFAQRGLDQVDPAAPVPPQRAAADQRLDSLDFVKGVLVVVMVLYHWLNYFIGLQWDGYRYLRFLTPAFICISGYLVSRVYLARYAADDPKLRWRLVGRAIKLLALFLALNVVIDWALNGGRIFNPSQPPVLMSWLTAVFVGGRGGVAAFDILISIAYFLLLAPFVLFISKRASLPLWLIAGVTIGGAAIVSYTGRINPHLEIVPLGFVGLAAGARSSGRVAAAVSSMAFLLPAYVVHLVGIASWNVSYPLLIVAVGLNLLLMGAIASVWGTRGIVQQCVVRLGQYSLLAYIAQIAILQLLRRGLQGHFLTDLGRVAVFAGALAATVAVVELVIWLRAKSSAFDRVYRGIFA
jgi:peptidoglycan/LPS O-acetylase OafA/YrhL